MATLTVRRGYYILNWSGPEIDPRTGHPRRHRTSLGRVDVLPRRDADAILRAKQYELSTGARILRVGRSPSPGFGDFARDYLAWHALEYPSSHERVRQIVEQHLGPRFGARPLDMLAIAEVEQYKTERRFRVQPATVEKELRTLNAIVNRAVLLDVIPKNPIASVRPPRSLDSKPHRFYEAHELAALYAACQIVVNGGEGPQPNPAHVPAWKLYANTGMRRMEGLHLRWRDVGADAMRIVSTGEERTKSGEWREIPLSDGARDALDRLRAAGGDHVLPQIHPESLSRGFVRDARRAGLDGSLHTLRHTYISHLVRAGVPLRTVQIYAGHAHYHTTEQYAYLSPGMAPVQVSRMAL